MLVYRVENSAGEGMYSADSSAGQDMQEIAGSHPLPKKDKTLQKNLKQSEFDLGFGSPFVFSFKDLDQLLKWIYDRRWRETLSDEGFSINVYECSRECFYGDTQAVFVKKWANVVNTISLRSI